MSKICSKCKFCTILFMSCNSNVKHYIKQRLWEKWISSGMRQEKQNQELIIEWHIFHGHLHISYAVCGKRQKCIILYTDRISNNILYHERWNKQWGMLFIILKNGSLGRQCNERWLFLQKSYSPENWKKIDKWHWIWYWLKERILIHYVNY